MSGHRWRNWFQRVWAEWITGGFGLVTAEKPPETRWDAFQATQESEIERHLEGMTVEQARELVRREEAARKVGSSMRPMYFEVVAARRLLAARSEQDDNKEAGS
jgi:hypothetical protein